MMMLYFPFKEYNVITCSYNKLYNPVKGGGLHFVDKHFTSSVPVVI